jgi:hypothetical protein
MRSRIGSHLGSNVVAYVALFLALGGGAYAAATAPRNSVVSRSIKNGQVKKPDLGRHSVTTSKFAGSSVAPDAAKLGGAPASSYQEVTAISSTPSAGNNVFRDLGHGLQVATICHDGATTKIAFQNIGSSGATLNWLESDGTSVNASGVALAANTGEQDFSFAGKRLEGQFIFANGQGVTTVNLHAFDGTSFCETQGTAEFAAP